MKRLAKSKNYRTYKIYGEDEYLDKFEEFIKVMETCGDWGSSRTFKLWVDGDGSFSLNFEKVNGKMNELEDNQIHKLIIDGGPINFSFD